MLNRLDGSMSQLLIEAGVKTISIDGVKFLSRNGLIIKRPNVEKCKGLCLSAFNIVI